MICLSYLLSSVDYEVTCRSEWTESGPGDMLGSSPMGIVLPFCDHTVLPCSHVSKMTCLTGYPEDLLHRRASGCATIVMANR